MYHQEIKNLYTNLLNGLSRNLILKQTAQLQISAAGPGLYTSSFAKRGKAKVTGIDFSSNSIKYARQTAEKEELKIDYICQNYLEFNTDKKFDLITMIMCDFCALSPEQANCNA